MEPTHPVRGSARSSGASVFELRRSPDRWLTALLFGSALGIALLLLRPGLGAAQETTLPLQVEAAVGAAAAAELGVQPADVEVLRAEAVTWTDGCLGAAEPGEVCTLALVQGYVVWVAAGGDALRYHTDASTTVRLAASDIDPGDVATAPLPAGATAGDTGQSLGRQTGEATCAARFPAGIAVGDTVSDVFVCIGQPAPGATVSTDVEVSGFSAGAFENAIIVELLGSDGTVVDSQPVQVAAPDIGLVAGDWSVTLNGAPLLAAATSAQVTIRAYAASAQDGSLDFGAALNATIESGLVPGDEQPGDGTYGGVALPIEGGIVLLTSGDASIGRDALASELEQSGCVVVTLAVTINGEWEVFLPSAPPFVNAGSGFPATVAAGTPFFLRCGDPAENGSGGPAFSADVIDETGRSGNAILTTVRIGEHHGFDRIVFEFSDEAVGPLEPPDGVPPYRVGYVDGPATECGSGMTVQLQGDAILEVHLPGSFVYNPDTGQQTVDVLELTENHQVVLELEEICGFEGVSTWVAGTNGEQPFRVFELSSPTRLVVDVQTP